MTDTAQTFRDASVGIRSALSDMTCSMHALTRGMRGVSRAVSHTGKRLRRAQYDPVLERHADTAYWLRRLG